MSPTEREALKAALRLPYPCFPCDALKRPAVRGGFKSARTVDSGLASMWARNPGELIGVPTGTASGFSVLDIDIDKGGSAWWSANLTRLSKTRIHETRWGGLHVLFQHQPGMRSTAGQIAPGIDTRGEGGYVIWWPAKGFGVINPDDLAPWPDWLTPPPPRPPPPPPAKVKRPQEQVFSPNIELNLRGIVKFIERTAEGGRNVALYWGAMRVAEYVAAGSLDRTWGAELLVEAAHRAGLPTTETQRTIASAMRRVGV